ncbi:MAG: fatty acid desaturase family protein [Cytophagaceae bacterium]
MSNVSFNNKNNPFFTSLKGKVNQYFFDNQFHTSGNKRLYFKSSIQTGSAIALYIMLVFFTPGIFLSLILCAVLGVNLAVLGFNIMHEGGHQTFSKYSWLNTVGAYFLNVLGGNIFFWKIKHNINHHTYTNIEGMDSDIDIKPFMRVHEKQSRLWIHKFQHIYCVILYGISYLVWIFWDDFQKYFTGDIATGQHRRMEIKEHLIFWVTKVLYIIVYLVVPIFLLGFAKALIGFAVISFVCGLSIGLVFQLAHVVEGTSFPEPSIDLNRIEQEWAIHQINTTANFSTNNKIVSWLLGGLNFQVEHHLFPRISHIHYPAINRLVKETCEEFKIKYLEYPSVYSAVHSHFSHIKRIGNT